MDEAGAEPGAPLSPTEMRVNRAVYLAHIAALLGLKQATSLQEECYDAFLNNYEESMRLHGIIKERARTFQTIKRVTVWEKDELVRRLRMGEAIPGFSYDPVTKAGTATFGFQWAEHREHSNELAAKRAKLRLAYALSFETKNGVRTYRGHFGPKDAPQATRAHPPMATPTEAFPVVIPVALTSLPAEESAARLWDGSGDRSLRTVIETFGRLPGAVPEQDATIAFLILHETSEVGIVDHYFRGADRRWFCDGVASYAAWRVVRDVHGLAAADRMHNLRQELTKYADLRAQADLRQWPATERQTEAEQHSRLDDARYAFAERAVALMNERAGEDCLPKLFVELGKTKREKVSMKSVEKAWKKTTGSELETILNAAMQPVNPVAVQATK